MANVEPEKAKTDPRELLSRGTADTRKQDK